MADTYTPNLNLKKPGYDSSADIADINANMDKIDAHASQLSQQMVDYRTAVSLFDNGDFLIAQAGYNGMHGNTKYAADRWIADSSITASYDGVGLTVLRSSGNPWDNIRQKVDVRHLKGAVVTLVAYCKTTNRVRLYAGGVDSGKMILNEYRQGDNSDDGVYVASVQIPSDITDDYVNFCFSPDYDGSGESVSKLRMALYPGEYTNKTVPPHVSKGYANELLACEVAENGNPFEQIAAYTTTINGISVALVRYGKTVTISLTSGEASSQTVASGVFGTLPDGFKPAVRVDFKDNYAGKRLWLDLDGRMTAAGDAIAAGTILRGTITYVCA